MDDSGTTQPRPGVSTEAWQAFIAVTRRWLTDRKAWLLALGYALVLTIAAWPLRGAIVASASGWTTFNDPALPAVFLELLLVVLIGAFMTASLLRPERLAYEAVPESSASSRPVVIALAKVAAAVAVIWLLVAATAVAMALWVPTARDVATQAASQFVVALAGLSAATFGAYWSTVTPRPWLAVLATSATFALLAGVRLTWAGDNGFASFGGWPWLPIGSDAWTGPPVEWAIRFAFEVAMPVDANRPMIYPVLANYWLPASLLPLLAAGGLLAACGRVQPRGRGWRLAAMLLLLLLVAWFKVGVSNLDALNEAFDY